MWPTTPREVSGNNSLYRYFGINRVPRYPSWINVLPESDREIIRIYACLEIPRKTFLNLSNIIKTYSRNLK
jgi:hypothetical protein